MESYLFFIKPSYGFLIMGNGKKRLLLFTVYGENGLIFSVNYSSKDWLWILLVCFFFCPTYYERKILREGLFDDEESETDDFSSLNLMPGF